VSGDQRPRAARGAEERYARKAAAFAAMLDHIPTANNPSGGDPEVVERAIEIIGEPPPDQGEDGT
jgi:hypothetical protein